jgi:hypothetical protein
MHPAAISDAATRKRIWFFMARSLGIEKNPYIVAMLM